jgi:hypothetical protein
MKLKEAKVNDIVRLDYMVSGLLNQARVVSVTPNGVMFLRPHVRYVGDGINEASPVGGEGIYFDFSDTRFNGETPESDARITLLEPLRSSGQRDKVG